MLRPALQHKQSRDIGPIGADQRTTRKSESRKTVQKSACRKFHHIGNDKRADSQKLAIGKILFGAAKGGRADD
jgi:hypothetical protein